MAAVRRTSVAAQVEHIRSSATRLTGMVDDLIADAMTDALDITIRARAGRPAALVAEVVEANRPLAERKQQAHRVSRAGALR